MSSELAHPLLPNPGAWAWLRSHRNTWVVLGLAAITLVLHGSALFSGWKFDDGPQLLFAAEHSPWQYFSVPEVMRKQSYAHITPWSVLFFDMGLPLFGTWAAGHYAHLLLVIWLTAVVTWILLGRWLSPGMALGGALIFLAMPSTGAVAHMLMTSHYAYGLLFSVLALLAFAHAAASDSLQKTWALIAALFYGLACLCKELYVPLVAVFLVWPALSWRAGIRLALPLLCVALLYAVFRLHVLGGMGGYAALSGGSATLQLGLSNLLTGLHSMQQALFGSGGSGVLALAIAASVVALAWWRGRRPSILLLMVSAVLLLAPVLPMLLFPFPNGLDRVMFFIGWAAAVIAVWQFEKLRWRGIGVAALAAALAIGQQLHVRTMESNQRPMMALNDFMIQGQASDKLVAVDFGNVGLLRAIGDASRLITGKPAPVVVGTAEDFIALDQQAGHASWAWQADCACIRPLGSRYGPLAEALHARWSAGQQLPLQVHLELADAGRIKTLRWRISGAPGDIHLELRDELRLAMPAQGTLAFGMDTTFHPPDPAQLRLVVNTPDQARVYSPWLSLPLSRSSVLDWQGLGSAPPPLE